MKWYGAVLLLFCFACSTLGDEPKWEKWPAVRTADSKLGTVLGDIASHVQSFQWYDGGNRETTAHENTHELSGDVRRKHGNDGSHQGVYCLEDRALAWSNPKISAQTALKDVTRGSVLMESVLSEWDNDSQPLYVFDELNAYTNGLQCALELKIEPAQQAHDFEAIDEFQRYCQAIIDYIGTNDPAFSDLQSLKDYLAFNRQLVARLHGSPIPQVPDYKFELRR